MKKRVGIKKSGGKGKMTLDGLAGMMHGEFVEIHRRFDGVDKCFDGVDKRFDGIDAEIKLVKGRLDAIEMELIEIKKKLNNIVYRHEFELLKDRIEKIEKKVGMRA